MEAKTVGLLNCFLNVAKGLESIGDDDCFLLNPDRYDTQCNDWIATLTDTKSNDLTTNTVAETIDDIQELIQLLKV